MSYIVQGDTQSLYVNLAKAIAEYAKLSVTVVPKPSNALAQKLIISEDKSIDLCWPALFYMCRVGASHLIGQDDIHKEACILDMIGKLQRNIVLKLCCGQALFTGCSPKQLLESVTLYIKNTLNSELLDKTYLVAERLSLADIIGACAIHKMIPLRERNQLFNENRNVARWYHLILNQVIVKKIFNTEDEKASATPSTPDVAPKKAGNPLDDLSPSPFVLDAWKRQYSNEKKIREVSMPWFWSNYDKEGYSLWYMRYDRTEGENTIDYTTANMLNGFLQRLDANFRKYSFAVLNVVGEKPQYDILGIWLIRGHVLPREVTEHPSFEYYTFRRLDHEDKSSVKLIEDYWCNSDSVEGRPISSCKVWK